jgi:glycosyltransferase involved in cell wall biosynthesis
VIRSTKVPILDSQNERELETTFLPLPSLKKIAVELELSQEFGFLTELDQMTEVESAKWSFLERFGVGIKEDLGFWLALLRRLKEKNNIKREYIFRIYRQLQKFTSEEEVEVLR